MREADFDAGVPKFDSIGSNAGDVLLAREAFVQTSSEFPFWAGESSGFGLSGGMNGCHKRREYTVQYVYICVSLLG